MKFFARFRVITRITVAALLCTLVFAGCGTFTNIFGKKDDSLGAMKKDMAERSAMEALTEMDEVGLRDQIDTGDIFEPNIQPLVPSIGILRPRDPALGSDEKYLAGMVRTTLNNNFRKFAEGYITVTNVDEADEAALQEEVQKSLSGSDDELSLTGRISAKALITGTITKAGEKLFNLDFSVTDTEKHKLLASYNKNHSDIELTGGIAVNKMTEYFLKELGVRLNEAGKLALLGNSNEAETALAKGQAAKDAGKGLEAMNYLYNAESFDATKQEASGSLVAVQTQNKEAMGAGDQVARYFEQQALWQDRLDEYNTFYRSHPPFELFYTPPEPLNMRGSGNSRAYDLSFRIGLRWSQNQIDVMEKVLAEYILDGLKQNPDDDIRRWELRGLPDESELFMGPGNFNFDIVINVENERGEVIVSGPLTLSGSLYRFKDHIYADCTQELNASFPGIPYLKEQITSQLYIRIASINGVDIKTVGENGFTRVVQVQGLPPAQRSSLPREFLALKQKEIDEEARKEAKKQEEATKQERAAAKAAEKERKRRESQNNPLKKSRGGMALTGGFMLGAEGAVVNWDCYFGSDFWNFDFGLMFYPGSQTETLTMDYKPSSHSSDDPSVMFFGIDTGFDLALVGRRWIFNAGAGATFFLAGASAAGESISNDFFVVPYLKTTLDWRLVGILFLRAGYRMDIYPPEKFYTYFENTGEKKVVYDQKLVDNIFMGISLIW
jgi:hypothetical protein